MNTKQYSDVLLNQTKDLIWIVDHQLHLVYANKSYLNLMKEVTGSEKELNTPILLESFGKENIDKWRAYYQRALSGEAFSIEEHFSHPVSKEIKYGHFSFTPIEDKDAKVQSVACRNTDITDNFREKYRASSLMNASLDVFCTINEVGNFVYVSDASKKHWGYTPLELTNTPFLDMVLKEDIAKTNTIADAIRKGEEVKSFVNRYKRKDGGIAYNLWSARWDNEAKLMYCVARDVKDKIEEEHRLKLLSSVITHTNDAVMITEAEPVSEPGPRIIYVNEAFTRMAGYTAEEVIGKTPRILQGPKSDKDALAKLGSALRKWQPYEITTINYKKNGEEFWINFTLTPVANENGLFTHWIAIERDVTAQKNAELEKSLLSQIAMCFREEKLNLAGKALCEVIRDFADFDLVELWCPNLEFTHVTRVASSNSLKDFKETNNPISQFSKGEGLPGKVWKQEKQLLWDQQKIAKYFLRKVASESAGLKRLLGVPLIHQNQITGVLVIGTAKGDESLNKFSTLLKNLEVFIGSEINRKRLEDYLKHLYRAIPEILCVADVNGRFLKMNPAGYKLLGYRDNEILFHAFDEFVHPEDKGIFHQKSKGLPNKSTVFNFENRFLSKDGQVIWLSWNCNTVWEDGLIYASAKNITEEVRLRELNKQAGSLAKIGSWEVNLKNNTVYWSEMVFKLHETNPDSFTPDFKNGIHFYREDFKELVYSSFEKCISTGECFDFEAVIITKKKKEKWVRVIGSVEFVNNVAKRLYGSFQDITDRKETELALIDSEAKFKTIFEIASLGIAQVNPLNGKVVLINSYYEKITGYSVEELSNMSFVDLTHPHDREKDWKLFSKASRGEGEYRNEKRYVKKDGTIVWVRLNVAFIRDESGKPLKTVAICENISDRKEVESQLKNLSDNLPGVVFQYLIFPDGTDVLRSVSKGSYQLWGYSPEEVEKDIDLVWNQTKAGGEFEKVKNDVLEAIKTKSKWFSRYRSVMPNGDIRMFIGGGTPAFLADGTVVFNSFVLDITKEAKNEELLAHATKMANIGSWEVNFVNNEVLWSDITHQLHETNTTSYTPNLENGIEFYREDFQKMVRTRVQACIEKGKPFDFEAVIITAKNNERWIRAMGRADMINGKCRRIHGSFQDIHAAKSNELRVKEILESISDAFYAIDADWNFTYFNKEAENLLKKTAVEVLGRNIWDLFQPAKGTILEVVYHRVALTGQSENFEYLYPGDDSWYEITTYPSSGGVSSYFKNIDERKRAAEDLKRAYKERNKVLESISDAFFAVDDKWTITYWNKQAETLLDRTKEGIVGKNLWEEFPDAIDTDFYVQYHQAMETSETINFEEYYPTLDVWLEVTVYPSENGLSIYFKDITLRKAADIRLINANERFEKVTEATNDAIWDWDIVNDSLYRSQNILKFFGKKTSTTLESKDLWTDSFHPDDLKALKESLNIALKDDQTQRWEMEYRILNENKNTLYVIDRGLIIRDNSGKAIRVIGAMTDVTERKLSELELLTINKKLEAQTRELERSNEELEQFAFITSHDLQEPLRMISSFMEQLDRKYADQLDDKAKQYIHYARDGAKRMKQIILDLLFYSRINRPTEMQESVNLNEIVSEFLQLRRKLIAEKKASVHVDQLPELLTYKAPITQIFHCLLDNALKYSREKVSPLVYIQVEDKGEFWKFAIKDNGIGIDKRFYEKVFIIFQRLHNRKEYDGTGIGLSIAKRAVTFLGGEIWVDSIVGEGSTFYFTISKTTNYTS